MGPSRSWVMYDAFADAVMLNMLMSRHHYYYDHPYGHRSGGSTSFLWFGMFCIVMIIGVAVYMYVNE